MKESNPREQLASVEMLEGELEIVMFLKTKDASSREPC
jgi:hypothetical protein